GAAALGDIGKLFPDTDNSFKNANSLELLKKVCEILTLNGYKIINIDSVIIAQMPKLSPFIDQMRENIAKECDININQVSVKATTEEGLGFTGALQGISSNSVCLLESIKL
ncbi:MAG: 2-C-methyl-D-erythritol 2,4-cyclodiphosphate synthase, partial [Oscillospiraceae bacterium]